MRTEREMLELIINVAKSDERIRAALMVGSRANPCAPKDKYQDFDITYFVHDISPFYGNDEWIIKNFGKPSIMQKPELMDLPPPDADGHFTWLMIFDDGNRVDLSIEFTPYFDDGEPVIVLLDKDDGNGFLPSLSPAPNDSFWHVKKPSPKLYADCCNEFWWCLNNVAKGVARDELPYAMRMYNSYVREMLDDMMKWYIGAENAFSVSAGKMGKYFKKHLPPELYEMYVKTYSDGDYGHFWDAVYTACDLFHILAENVAEYLGVAYNQSEEDGMRGYFMFVREENSIR